MHCHLVPFVPCSQVLSRVLLDPLVSHIPRSAGPRLVLPAVFRNSTAFAVHYLSGVLCSPLVTCMAFLRHPENWNSCQAFSIPLLKTLVSCPFPVWSDPVCDYLQCFCPLHLSCSLPILHQTYPTSSALKLPIISLLLAVCWREVLLLRAFWQELPKNPQCNFAVSFQIL